MDDSNRYALMIEALTELAPEIAAARGTTRFQHPPLSRVLADAGHLPKEALFLGLAEDGFPVLLNLADSVPGPILLAGDSGSGKTAFLQNIARAADWLHTPQDVQYGVISAHPEEWQDIAFSPNCIDVFPCFDAKANDFLLSMSGWAHSHRGEKRSILLLIDDLSFITKMDFDARQNLRWLLLRGPARRVWPIVTLNPKDMDKLESWLELFRLRFFGQVEDQAQLRRLSRSFDDALMSLQKGVEFAMPEANEWLKFWIPSLD
ncbi:MAG TPA: hypothetical protein VGJ22_07170 [Anaerolineales bacterium]|jgi:hypothetical protein